MEIRNNRIFPGWWQVAVALVLQAASSASVFTAYSVIAVPLQEAFQPSRMMLMMGITAAALASGSLSPPLGAAIDRFSLRLLMLGGTLALGSGFVLLSFTSSMNQVVSIYLILLSVGGVLTGPLAGSALLARWFTRRRGLAMGIAASGAAVGGLIVPPLLQFLIETFEWRTALQIYGVSIFLITAPLVGLLIINRPSDRNLHPDGYTASGSTGAAPVRTARNSMGFFLRDRNFWLVAFCLGMLLAGPMGLTSNLLPFVLEKGIDATSGAVLLSIFSAANFLGKLTSGVVSDRIDYRIMLVAILLTLCFGFAGYLQIESYTVLAVFTCILGFGQGATVPLWSVILAKTYGPDNMGRSMGVMSFIIVPFTLAAPPLCGRVYDSSGSYDNALLGYLVILLLTVAIIGMIRKEQPVPVPAI